MQMITIFIFMFSYPEINEHLPIAEQRKFALTRRVDKLIGWLHQPEYTAYENDDSTDRLVKLINLVIYALEMSLPDKEWRRFKRKFNNTKQLLLGVPDTEEFNFEPDEKANYEKALAALLSTLEDYKAVLLKIST